MTPPLPPDEIARLMRFVADKAKNVTSPMNVMELCRQFKEETGSLAVLNTLGTRIRTSRQKIQKMDEFDMATKVKMMFAVSAPIDKRFLKELKKQADVEVDEKGRITKYKANDGNLDLKGSYGQQSIQRSLHSDRWQKVCQKASCNDSEEEGDEDSNGQKSDEKKRMVRFLIKRTKNVTSPLSVKQLAKDYLKEFKSSDPLKSAISRITLFRHRIHETNQFDISTKVKMLFALSAPIDASFLKKLLKNAVVELDVQLRIKKYKAKDGSLGLEGDHSMSAKIKAAKANMIKSRVVNDSSESEGDDGEEEDHSESDEEGAENIGGLVKSDQASTSSTSRRSEKIRKSTVSTSNNNKKRATDTQKQTAVARGRKRTRISYSSSGTSEEEQPEEDDDEESEKSEDDKADSDTNNIDNDNERNYAEDVEKGVPKEASTKNDKNLEHIGIGSKSAMDNVPEERKPESLIEVKTEVPEEPSGGENGLIEPKIEESTREVKQAAKEDEEGTSASSSAKIESMSLLDLLNHLRSPVAQYTPALIHRMDEKIRKLEEKDKQIPFKIVLESLEMCIQLLNTLEEMDSDENTTSLPNFFYHLGTAMCIIKHSMMNDFYSKIKKLACTVEKKVSLEHIRYVMGKTLDRILH